MQPLSHSYSSDWWLQHIHIYWSLMIWWTKLQSRKWVHCLALFPNWEIHQSHKHNRGNNESWQSLLMTSLELLRPTLWWHLQRQFGMWTVVGPDLWWTRILYSDLRFCRILCSEQLQYYHARASARFLPSKLSSCIPWWRQMRLLVSIDWYLIITSCSSLSRASLCSGHDGSRKCCAVESYCETVL